MAKEPGNDGVNDLLRGLHGGPGRAVLIIEPNPDQQSRLARQVTVRGHRVIGTSSLDGALALLREFPVDLVLVSEALVAAEPLRIVGELVSARPNARVVIMTLPPTPSSATRRRRSDPALPVAAPTAATKPATAQAARPRPGALEYIARPFSGEALSTLLAG